MKRIGNTVMVVLYSIASIFMFATGMARIIFYREWIALWDAQLLICAALFIIVFYGALLIGYKRQRLERWTVRTLCWTDAVIFGLQMIGIGLVSLLPFLFGRLSWGQTLPVALCDLVFLLLRLLSTCLFVKKSKDC